MSNSSLVFDSTICNVRNEPDVPVEMLSKIKSILAALKECNEKLKISLLMPVIFNESVVICELLKNTEYGECAKLLKECVAKLKKDNLSTKCKGNELLILKFIDCFQNNHQMLKFIENVSYEFNNENDCFLSALNTLHDMAKKRLLKDARAELLMEKSLHAIYWENKKVCDYHQTFCNRTYKDKVNMRWRIAAKEVIFTDIDHKFKQERFTRNINILKEEKIADKKHREAQKFAQVKQKELEEDVERAGESLAKTLKKIFISENDVRAEHNKLQIQLQTLLKKYDTVLLEKSKNSILMDQKLKAAQEEFDEFFKYYSEKEDAYNRIIIAMERKKQREFQEKLANFIGNRAAKIIQKQWKRYIKILRKERAEEKGKSKKK